METDEIDKLVASEIDRLIAKRIKNAPKNQYNQTPTWERVPQRLFPVDQQCDIILKHLASGKSMYALHPYNSWIDNKVYYAITKKK